MRIDLLRHGECNDQAWLRGRTDSSLSEKGLLQMQAALQHHQKIPSKNSYQKIISSPAKRCSEFCYQAWSNQNSIKITEDDAWQERDFGVFDGLSFEKIQQRYPNELDCYLNNPYSAKIPQAESFENFQNRIYQAWLNLIQTDFDSILVVTHGGSMRLVLQQVLGLSNQQLFNLQLDYAARVSIEVIATESSPFCKLVELVQIDEDLLEDLV